MYLLITLLPLFSFIIIILLGRFIGTSGSCFIATFNMGVSTLISFVIFFEVVLSKSTTHIALYNWFVSNLISVDLSLVFDPLTSFMVCLISLVSFCAHLYSIEYMSTDPHKSRFFSFLSLFTFCMNILVTSGNLIQLFVGWEGVGICSFFIN
jgi:NADH:ubiquinone oxidoreductase subunit 5 (subunit L)/multisubunit Na+/H+ antiporter MnhA subunit